MEARLSPKRRGVKTMAKRSPQTQAKRQRERDKMLKRQEKQEKRAARKLAKGAGEMPLAHPSSQGPDSGDS